MAKKDTTKLVLGIVGGIIAAALLFCLAVCIACSVNGLTFSQQVVSWFSSSNGATKDVVKDVIETASRLRI